LNLIIDTGNTRTKLALYKNDKLQSLKKVKNKKTLSVLKNLFQDTSISNAIISSVADIDDEVLFFLEDKINSLIILNSATKIPFKNLYRTPKTLGVDRIALMAASQNNYPNTNVLVIDAGTCITYDLLNAKNEYFGGAIAPGINMKYKAMHHFTANLPLLKPKANVSIGNSTKNAMHQGVINGTLLEIEGIINQYKKNNDNLTVVLTGGDTIFLAKLLKSSIFANPNFLLEGLNHILNYNLLNND
jgi:type III pantothenate kinase